MPGAPQRNSQPWDYMITGIIKGSVPMMGTNTVDGKNPAPLGMPQKVLIVGKKQHLGHPEWCRIFSISSITH